MPILKDWEREYFRTHPAVDIAGSPRLHQGPEQLTIPREIELMEQLKANLVGRAKVLDEALRNTGPFSLANPSGRPDEGGE